MTFLKKIEKGSQVELVQDVSTKEGIFTKGHKFCVEDIYTMPWYDGRPFINYKLVDNEGRILNHHNKDLFVIISNK